MESWAVAMMSFVSAVLSANLRILVMARKINVVLASLSVLSMLILLIWQLFFDVLPIGCEEGFSCLLSQLPLPTYPMEEDIIMSPVLFWPH